MIKPVGLHLIALAAGAGVGAALLASSYRPLLSSGVPSHAELAQAVSRASSEERRGGIPTPDRRTVEVKVPIEYNGGTFSVPVLINNSLSLRFTIDSGASDVMIPLDVADALLRTGTITDSDIIRKTSIELADGRVMPSEEFRIRSLRVGNLDMRDVTASTSPRNGPLLLGQTFLTHLSGWSIDNSGHALLLRVSRSDIDTSGSSERRASATPLPDLLGPSQIDQVASDFNDAINAGGMGAVASYIEDCYSSISTEETEATARRAAFCITADLLAERVDEGVREIYQRKGEPVPPSSSFDEGAVRHRVARYLPMTGISGSHPNAMIDRYVSAAMQRFAALADKSAAPASG